MAINWFEGGRRVFALFSVLILLGGAAYAIFAGGDNRVILETSSPSDAFHWTLKGCNYPDQEKAWDGKAEFKSGDPRIVAACFRVNKNGKLWYDFGPEQQMQLDPINGKAPPPLKYRKMLEVDTYTDAADAYMDRRMKEYKPTRAQFDAIGKDQWMIAWVNFWDRVREAAPWVAGLLFGLWVLTTALGWIIRGFAGIPSGKDFRTDRPEHTNAQRASGDWIGVAIGGVVIAGAVAWAISVGTGAAAPQIGRFISKSFQLVGVLICLGMGVAGGYGLWLLIHEIRRLKPIEIPGAMFWVMSLANAALVALISWPLNEYTVMGEWVTNLDRWSRANGYADGGTMILFSVCLLWPFIPLMLLWKYRGAANAASISTE